MKKGFKIAGKIFKYLSLLFTLFYWTYVIYDDWNFIQEYWTDHWLIYLGVWFAWFAIYFFTFALYYWALATLIILLYYKLIRPKSNV